MDTNYNQYVQDFLHCKNIGVAGFSLKGDNPGNYIYQKLKENGHDVFAINPKGGEVKGVNIYQNVAAVPVQLEAMVICTHPSLTESVIEDCAKVGVKIVWIHKSIGEGSFSSSAVEKAKKLGLKVIPIGCPMMFVKPDFFHKCFKFFMRNKLKV